MSHGATKLGLFRDKCPQTVSYGTKSVQSVPILNLTNVRYWVLELGLQLRVTGHSDPILKQQSKIRWEAA